MPPIVPLADYRTSPQSSGHDCGTGLNGAEKTAGQFHLTLTDDDVGIDPRRLERPATLRALRQRTEALGAELQVVSSPGNGTQLALTVPLERKRRRKPVTP